MRSGDTIRLHKADLARIHQLTGVSPIWITNVSELNEFIDHQIGILSNPTPESKLICSLLADERIKP